MKDYCEVFEKSGIASLEDTMDSGCQDIFALLERKQELFLLKEQEFRSTGYKWPRDPLHTWSRIWEYPYVYYHLKSWMTRVQCNRGLHAIDVGSGVSFFPFAVADLNYRVTCTDIDAICAEDVPRAAQALKVPPSNVQFRLSDGKRLPFKDEEADVVYCISVLEHVPDYEPLIEEMARVMKSGGLLILTIDLDIGGDSEIGAAKYRELLKKLHSRFSVLYPQVTTHPASLLTSRSGPYALKSIFQLRNIPFILKSCATLNFKNISRNIKPPLLTVEGLTLTKN
jgi:ubiquinone/menaquinone biosynthesis C-methylase UbiE